MSSPKVVAVAKPPGGLKPAAPVSVKPAAAVMVKPAAAKLPADLSTSPRPISLSDDGSKTRPQSTGFQVQVAGNEALKTRANSAGAGNLVAPVGLAKPVGVNMKKPPPNFAKKPAAPVATEVTPTVTLGFGKKPAPAGAKPRPVGPGPGNHGISTLRNRWEHTTSTAAYASALSDAKTTMCEKKNLQSLLKLYRCNNVRVQSLTQEVLDNLEETSTGELCMEVKNGFRPLVDLTKFDDDDYQVWALWALANLAAHAPCQVAIIAEVGWHNIKTKYAASNLDEMKQATCLLLANLSYNEKIRQGIVEKGVPILVAFAKSADATLSAHALRALGIISTIKEYGAKQVWDDELLPIIIPYVMNDNDPASQSAALHVLCNICADHTAEVHQTVLGSGVLDMLVSLLNSDNADTVGYAAMTLAHLAKTAHGANEIRKCGGHSTLIPLLDSSNQFVQIGVATAVNNLADYREVGLEMKQQDAVEPLSELILATPSEAVEQQALQALEKLDKEAWKFVERKLQAVSKAFRTSVMPTMPQDDDEDNRKKEDEARKVAAAAAARKTADDASKSADAQRAEEERKAAEQRKAEELKKKKQDEEEEKKRRLEDEQKRKRQEEDNTKRIHAEDETRKKHREEEDRKRKEKDDEADRKREEEERKRMYERLEKEEQIERSRMELLRSHDEEKRKLDEQKRLIAEEKMRMDLAKAQREEEDRIRAQKDRVERELDDKKKSLMQVQLDEERRKSEERLREELIKVERQKHELEVERAKIEDARSRDLNEERRMMEERMKLEKELLEKSRKALEEEKKLIEKLQREKEEEEKMRSERLKMEHAIEMQKLLAEKNKLLQERQRMDEDAQAEKIRLEKHKEEMLADIERRRREELERTNRDKEMQSLLQNSTGALYAEEIKAMEARMKADREALEAERKLLNSMREDKLALDMEKDNIERSRKRFEEDRKMKEHEDSLRRQQELLEIEALRRKIEEDQNRADEEKRKFHIMEGDWTRKLEEEKLQIERDKRKLEDDEKSKNKTEDEEKRIAAEQSRIEEEKARLAKERDSFDVLRQRLLDVEEKGDASRTRELELLIHKEEEARSHAEAERRRLEELERSIQEERRKAEEQKQAIQSLLEQSNSEDVSDPVRVELLREEAARLKEELDRMRNEKDEIDREKEDLDDIEDRISHETEKRIKAQKKITDKENEGLTNALADKEFELAMRERKLREAEAELMNMMGKIERGYDDTSTYSTVSHRRGRSVDSSRSRSRSRSRSASGDSVDSRRRGRRVQRRSTSLDLKDKWERSRSRTRSRSISASDDDDYTQTDNRSNSSHSRYTVSVYDDDDTYTRTHDMISDDEDDLTQSTSFYERSPFSRPKKNARGSLMSPNLKRKNKRDATETRTDLTDSQSEYTESQWSDEDLKRSANSIRKYASPRAGNYVDTPDGFDGGLLSDNDFNDNASVASMEGLVETDPHKAARELMKLLASDETRKLREPSLESLQKFARVRGGEPTQFEARDLIPVLLNVLNVYPDRSHQSIIAITLLILAILAYNKDVNQLYIRRENGGHTFIELLNFPIVNIKARACLAIAAYTLNNPLIKRDCAHIVPKLLALLQEHQADEPLKMAVCAALASLADDNKDIQKRILRQKGVKLIMSMIASNQIPPKYALNLIAALSHRNKKVQNQVREGYKGIFRKLVKLLSPYTKSRILQATVQALVELVRQNRSNKKEMAQSQAVPFLINLLTSKNNTNPELVAGALYLCWACSKYLPNKFQNEEFRNPLGGMEQVIAPLKSIESEQVQKILEQIDSKLRQQSAQNA